jgi:hypothetical protein
MEPIDNAVEGYKLQEPGKHFLYAKVAEKYGISQCTLA